MGMFFKSKGIKEKDVLEINRQRETLIHEIKALIKQEPSDSNIENMKAWIEMLEDNENGHSSLDEIKVFNQVNILLQSYRKHRIKKIENDEEAIQKIYDKASKKIFAEIDSLIYDALSDLNHPQTIDEMYLQLAEFSSWYSSVGCNKEVLRYKTDKLASDVADGVVSEEEGSEIYDSEYAPMMEELDDESENLRAEIMARKQVAAAMGVDAINMTTEAFEAQMKQSIEDRYAKILRKAAKKREERERRSKKMDTIKETYYGEKMKLQESKKESNKLSFMEKVNQKKIDKLNASESANVEQGEIKNEQKNG